MWTDAWKMDCTSQNPGIGIEADPYTGRYKQRQMPRFLFMFLGAPPAHGGLQ